MIRSRDKESLIHLVGDLSLEPDAIYSSLPSDYPYRVIVTKIEYANWCHSQAMRIDYLNFKAEAARLREGRFLDFLHDVWAAGLRLTDRDAQAANDAAWDDREDHYGWP